MAQGKKKRPSGPSGRTLTYTERKDAGRATRSFTLSDQTMAWLDALVVQRSAPSRSAALEALIREEAARVLQKK